MPDSLQGKALQVYTYFLPSNGLSAHLSGRIALAIGSAYCPDLRSPLLASGQWWAPLVATYGPSVRTTLCICLATPRRLRLLVVARYLY